ncbi:hypothetical protein MSHI_28700 [Mycobacterium shinjukuense]|uniref:Uncharacterized protein n=1 Tax=Mycobacterium shinjukuense TaxID=398694 RepID=A0A7I7MRU9_9MYCO|nr:hypothetical protein MSHI_28700 [Mycobacterium shinjukuense]
MRVGAPPRPRLRTDSGLGRIPNRSRRPYPTNCQYVGGVLGQEWVEYRRDDLVAGHAGEPDPDLCGNVNRLVGAGADP